MAKFGPNCCLRFLLLLTLGMGTAGAQQPQMAESSRLMDSGMRLYNAGNLDTAIATLRQAVDAWPKNGMAYFNLGLVLADKGDLAAVATAYEYAVALMEAPPA